MSNVSTQAIRQQTLLYAAEHPNFTTVQMAADLGITPVRANHRIQNAKKNGMLTRVGKIQKDCKYRITEAGMKALETMSKGEWYRVSVEPWQVVIPDAPRQWFEV